jgi:hypothetical protein
MLCHYLAALRILDVKFPGLSLTLKWTDSMAGKQDFRFVVSLHIDF